MSQLSRKWLVSSLGLLGILTLFLVGRGRQEGYNHGHAVDDTPFNSTFGFERIIAINLKERIDKRMALTLSASLSGVTIDFMDAPDAAHLSLLGLPPLRDDMPNGAIACFLGHYRAWTRQIEERWQTVLVMEDDADWDVHLKEEFKALAEPLSRLSAQQRRGSSDGLFSSPPPDPADPYNSHDWDLIHIGHCLEAPHRNNVSLAYNDIHTPSWNDTPASVHAIYDHYGLQLPRTPGHPETDDLAIRIVQKSERPVCSSAYVVSLQGAQRLIQLSKSHWWSGVDVQMMVYIEDERLVSYSVVPPLTSQWKNGEKFDSDIHMADGKIDPLATEQPVRKTPNPQGHPANSVKSSVRMKAQAILFEDGQVG